MGKVRTIVITAVAIFTACAAVFSVVNRIKAKQLTQTVRAVDALVRNTPAAGDELYLQLSAGDLFQLTDNLWTYEYGDDEQMIVVPVFSDTDIGGSSVLFVKVQASDTGMPDKVAQAYRDYYQKILDRLLEKKAEGLPENSNVSEEEFDELIALMESKVSDEAYAADKSYVASYTLTATGMPDYQMISFVSGFVAMLLGIVLLYAVLGIWISGKKLVIGSIAVVTASAIVGVILLRNEIATMMSIREYAPGMYVCNVTNDYKLDELLSVDIKNSDAMIEIGSKTLLGGVPLSTDAHNYACSSFSCVDKDGTHMFGRNYDYLDADGMILYSDQEGAYASIAVCDLSWVNMAGEGQIAEPDSFIGRYVLRGISPLMCVDGMNDQGLGISILSLSYAEYREDTDKTDTIVLIMIRAILDKCATVDEAVALLSSYDVHSMFSRDFHLFITDKSGKSVIAEWVDGKLTVTEIDHVTNYNIAAHEYDEEDRFVAMENRLAKTGGVLSIEEALDLLHDVAQTSDTVQTEWSCVYDLDHFVLYIYNDCDRDNVYIISPESFGVRD